VAAVDDPFVDHMNLAGDLIEMPSWNDLLALASRLESGHLIPFSLSRQSDRDAGMDFKYAEGQFAVVGAEDSKDRGTFAFCLLDRAKSDRRVYFGDEYPEYCTTGDIGQVIRIAHAYFRAGELERSVSWHVCDAGLGRKLSMIPSSEILRAGDAEVSLEAILSRLRGVE
jgi:hypothetical protein